MTKQDIIKFLKNYKHKPNEIVSYVTMNDINNNGSVTDEQNIISTAVKSKDHKFVSEMIGAIFNVEDVAFDKKTNEYVIIERKGANDISISKVKIQEQKGKIVIDIVGDSRKKNIVFETPDVLETDFKKVKQDIIKELQGSSISSKKDFENFVKRVLNTKF